MILTIALVVVVATLPWWEYVSSSGTHLYHYLGAWCYAPGSCVDYTDRGAPFRDVFPQTYVLVLTALALSVFELAFLVLAIFGNGGRLGILVTGILGSVALLVAPIYLYLGLSGSHSLAPLPSPMESPLPGERAQGCSWPRLSPFSSS